MQIAYHNGNRINVLTLINWNPEEGRGSAICQYTDTSGALPQEKFVLSFYDIQFEKPKSMISPMITIEEVQVESLTKKDMTNIKPDDNSTININIMKMTDIAWVAEMIDGIGEVTLSNLIENRPNGGYNNLTHLFQLNSKVRISQSGKESLQRHLIFS